MRNRNGRTSASWHAARELLQAAHFIFYSWCKNAARLNDFVLTFGDGCARDQGDRRLMPKHFDRAPLELRLLLLWHETSGGESRSQEFASRAMRCRVRCAEALM